MSIDNLNLIKPFLTFESADDFYYLQILQRKKENPELGSNSRVIKNYYIKSTEYLENRYEEIKSLCDQFNGRAMLRLNKRSFEKVAFKAMQNIANTMANREYSFIPKSYDRACGLGHNDKNKKWILDIDLDTKNLDLFRLPSFLENYLKSTEPLGNKVYCTLPSKNGIHIITKPFDLRKFTREFPDVEIHKDNPTNLYIP